MKHISPHHDLQIRKFVASFKIEEQFCADTCFMSHPASSLEIVREIATDDFGTLSLSKDPITNHQYYLRRIAPEVITDPAAFKAEFDLLTTLKHPILLLPNRLSEPPTLLSKFVETAPLTPSKDPLVVAKIIFGIAEGMRHLHANGILNPLYATALSIAADGRPIISNIGLLKYLDKDRQRSLIGVDIGAWSKEADVLTFGHQIYHLLTGTSPPEEGELPYLDGIPDGLVSLISSCWHSDVNRRPTFENIILELLAHDLSLPGCDLPEFHTYVGTVVDGAFASRTMIRLLRYGRSTLTFESATINDDHALNRPKTAGIFERLSAEAGGNIHELGIVTLTGNYFDDLELQKMGGLVTLGWKGNWESKDEPSSWVQFDFHSRLIIPKKYEIETWRGESGHLSDWVLEGSEDGRRWQELDRRSGVTQLCVPGRRCCFNCRNSRKCRFVKLTQTELNSGQNDILNLTNMEFFGDLLNRS